MGLLDILGQPTDSIWGMINRLPSLFSQQEPPKRIDQPLKPTKEMTKNRLLDSIYNAEGKENARIPFGMFTQEFERRSATGEIIPYEEARAETSRHIDRHIKRWEAGGSRNILNAKARGLINANPEKNEAIIDGEWNPDFLKWYGEIYAPSHLSNTTLRPAEKEKNHNWLGNVRSGLNVPSPVPTPPQMQQPPLEISGLSGNFTTEGRPMYHNNFGGESSENSIGVTDPRINNNALTHIPSIYDGKILNQKDAIQKVVDANGYDRLTGRFIEPGGDPEARSKSIVGIPRTESPYKKLMYPPPKPQIPINKSHMYPPPKRRSLEEVTQTAQVQPALSPFPWLREVSGSYSHPSPPVGRWV